MLNQSFEISDAPKIYLEITSQSRIPHALKFSSVHKSSVVRASVLTFVGHERPTPLRIVSLNFTPYSTYQPISSAHKNL